MNKFIIIIGLPIALMLAGCTGQTTTSPADEAKIETCWKTAGISGDLHRFLTLSQAQGLQASGGISETQVATFKQCLNS